MLPEEPLPKVVREVVSVGGIINPKLAARRVRGAVSSGEQSLQCWSPSGAILWLFDTESSVRMRRRILNLSLLK